MTSVVAVASDGEIAGHCALLKEHPDDAIAEVGMAVVKPKFRGQGCLKQLSVVRLEQAEKQGLTGIFGKGVANHPFSQKAMHKFVFADCSILLCNVPLTMSFKGINDELAQRDSHVIAFKYLKRPESVIVHAPLHHREMIRKIYANLELDPQFSLTKMNNAGSPSPTEEIIEEHSVLKTKVNATRGVAYIDVISYGKNIHHAIHARLQDLCLKRIDVIYLYLNLSDPLTAAVCADIEKLGFFFGGVFHGKAKGPENATGDALILQYLNNVPMDYEKIAVASDLAKELRDYIEAHDPNKRDE